MKKEIVLVAVVLVLVAVPLFFLVMSPPDDVEEVGCVDVNKGVLDYKVCYNSYKKNLFMIASRGFDDYVVDSFSVSFNDGANRSYDFKNPPEQNSSVVYLFAAAENPRTINAVVNVAGDFVGPACEAPKKLFVRYCQSSSSDSVDDDDVIIDDDLSNFPDDIRAKEDAWREICASDWECFGWESCDGGFQRRLCEDRNDCAVSTDAPQTVRYCSGQCIEDWKCEWSGCEGGFSTPYCIDRNDCETTYSLPKKIACSFEGDCSPDVQCADWSKCEVDYNFVGLTNGRAGEFDGVKHRICRDVNSCLLPVEEVEKCAVGVDIYTQKVEKCGKKFVVVYNTLDDELVARMEEGGEDAPHLNIYFDEGDTFECDYCSNGVMDEDETGVDCGGDCGVCEDGGHAEKSWLSRLRDWVGDLF